MAYETSVVYERTMAVWKVQYRPRCHHDRAEQTLHRRESR
jgi:hypothetical protein